MKILIKNLKQHLKPILVPLLIKLAQVYVYWFYRRLARKNIFDVNSYLKDSHVLLKFHNQTHLTFGIYNVLRHKYASIIKWDTLIEHGVYFGKYVHLEYQYTSNVITINQERQELLAPKHECLAVGLYIAYADNLYNEKEFAAIKQALGKTLLVFPSHSSPSANAVYDEAAFIEQIEETRLKYNYDSVIICLYWLDIVHGKHHNYVNKDYKIVSAGHRFDPFFLHRLKTIINLSDHCLTNGLGTHVGYCLFLGKPLIHVQQKIEYKTILSVTEYKDHVGHYFNNDWLTEYSKVSNLFNSIFDDQPTITQEKLDFASYYWGFSYVSA